METVGQYEAVISAIEQIYGIKPKRIHPSNLRGKIKPPLAVVGWSSSDVESEYLGVTFVSNVFAFAYVAENEERLLEAISKLNELIDVLPEEQEMASITRILNNSDVMALDYAFTSLIKVKEE